MEHPQRAARVVRRWPSEFCAVPGLVVGRLQEGVRVDVLPESGGLESISEDPFAVQSEGWGEGWGSDCGWVDVGGYGWGHGWGYGWGGGG